MEPINTTRKHKSTEDIVRSESNFTVECLTAGGDMQLLRNHLNASETSDDPKRYIEDLNRRTRRNLTRQKYNKSLEGKDKEKEKEEEGGRKVKKRLISVEDQEKFMQDRDKLQTELAYCTKLLSDERAHRKKEEEDRKVEEEEKMRLEQQKILDVVSLLQKQFDKHTAKLGKQKEEIALVIEPATPIRKKQDETPNPDFLPPKLPSLDVQKKKATSGKSLSTAARELALEDAKQKAEKKKAEQEAKKLEKERLLAEKEEKKRLLKEEKEKKNAELVKLREDKKQKLLEAKEAKKKALEEQKLLKASFKKLTVEKPPKFKLKLTDIPEDRYHVSDEEASDCESIHSDSSDSEVEDAQPPSDMDEEGNLVDFVVYDSEEDEDDEDEDDEEEEDLE